MKISKQTILTHPARGSLTLQVPQYSIAFELRPGWTTPRAVAVDPSDEKEDLIDAPDDWFMEIKNNRLVCGREEGYTYLSPKGYAAMKDEVLAAFKAAGQDPERFERYAASLFLEIIEGTRKAEMQMRTKANALLAAGQTLVDQVREIEREAFRKASLPE